MSELTAKHLVSNGVKKVLVANRTYERAAGARRASSTARRSSTTTCSTAWREADIVISSTAATHYVVTKERGRRGAQGPQGQPALPHRHRACRATSTRPSTTWPTSTSTTSTTSTASSRRTSRSACARPSAPRSSSPRRWLAFERWLESLEVVPTVAAIRAKAEAIRSAELAAGDQAPRRPLREGTRDRRGAHRAPSSTRCCTARRAPQGTSPPRRTATPTSSAARYLYGLDSNPEGKSPHGLGLIARSSAGREKASAKKNEMGDSVGI